MQKLNVGNLSETAKNRAEKTGGRFCVLTKSLVFDIIFKGENNAKTSSQKKRKRNIPYNASWNKSATNF